MSLSPAVVTREEDRTFNINNITTNTTGYVGMFKWGAVEQVTRISAQETELVQKFGRPDKETSLYFHSALNYLLYANPLLIVRVVGDDARNAVTNSNDPILIKNNTQYESLNLTGYSFIGRYPGALANGIIISVATEAEYDTWDYRGEFVYTPAADEFNLVVVDGSGFITGVAGTVLERYELLSKTEGAKRPDGTSAFVKKVLFEQSRWVLCGDESSIDFTSTSSLGVYEVELSDGVDDNDAGNTDFEAGWSVFSNSELYDVFRVFTSGSSDLGKTTAIDVAVQRQDMIVFVAPELDNVYNTEDAEINVSEYFLNTINKNTSYAFYVDNWKQVYDKYNDTYIWIPTDSDAAALHARLGVQNELWFSPAGLNRGQIKNVIKLAWNPNKSQRDHLYKNSINSIVSFPGEGTVLWGDKTALRRPSAFSRINVRTLFIILKKNISSAARYQLFEFNDFITRSTFTRSTTQYLDTVQSRRGVTEFRVVCNESNNTPEVIDNNDFVGDIYVKPNRVINTIRLNFVAVATGVSFEEIEGQ